MKKIITILLMSLFAVGFVFAGEETAASGPTHDEKVELATAQNPNGGKAWGPIGAGLVVLGAGIGIGMFASSAARSIARQPEAAKEITGAVNLPLFLLEGVAIIALVVCLLAGF